MAKRKPEPFNASHLWGLRCYDAYIRVWVAWSTDPKDVEMATKVRQGFDASRGLWARVRNYLEREGYIVHAAGPSIIGGGRAPIITEKGQKALAEGEKTS